MKSDQNKLILRNKCILVGQPTVGKSALVQQYHSSSARFPKNYLMTVQCEHYVKMVNIPSDPYSFVELFLFDMAGVDIFQEYANKYMEGAGSFVLVYDVTQPESFQSLTKWLDIAKKACHPVAIGKVIANKIDLTARRMITTEQGQAFAKTHGLDYYETSALTRTHIDQPFMDLCHQVHRQYEEAVQKFQL